MKMYYILEMDLLGDLGGLVGDLVQEENYRLDKGH